MMRSKSSVVLIVMQIALTLAIVSNAAFIIHERINDMNRDTGIPESQVVAFFMYFFDDEVDIIQQLRIDGQKVKELPGVINASAINQVPLSGSGDSWSVRNQAENEGAISVGTGTFFGGVDVVSSLGLTVSRGRDFRPEDMIARVNGDEEPQVVIITQALADKLFPEQDALGKTLYTYTMPLQIIGIIDQMQGPWVHSELVERNMFVPVEVTNKFFRFAIHVEPEYVEQVMADIQEYMLSLENRRVVNPPMTVAENKSGSYQNDRLMTNMLIIIITVLVFITALGIAGMTIFNVNRRQKQIGTRRAIGATKNDIISYFLTESFIMCALGLVLGSIGAVVLSNYLMSYFQSSALSINYIIGTIVGIVIVVAFSVFWPARKASMISPAIATRSV